MPSEKEADSMMKKAEKLLQPSMLQMRMKPAWDDAMPLFEKAAQYYKLCNCRDKAIVAYEKAAEANLRGGGTEWHAAKHLEDAAKLSAEGRNWSQTAEFTRQASQNYVDCGKEIPAAECLAKGARMLEEASPGQACELYKAAIAMYSRSEMAAMADDTVQRAVMVLLNARQPDDAASVLLQWASICHRTGSHAHMCRAYLGVIVMHLHAGNAQQAWQSYQDFLDVEEFSTSAEAYAVENLLEAYCSGNEELIQKKTSSGNCWRALDAAVSKLVKQLPSHRSDLKAMSAFFNSQMHEGEDLNQDEGDAEDDDFLT